MVIVLQNHFNQDYEFDFRSDLQVWSRLFRDEGNEVELEAYRDAVFSRWDLRLDDNLAEEDEDTEDVRFRFLVLVSSWDEKLDVLFNNSPPDVELEPSENNQQSGLELLNAYTSGHGPEQTPNIQHQQLVDPTLQPREPPLADKRDLEDEIERATIMIEPLVAMMTMSVIFAIMFVFLQAAAAALTGSVASAMNDRVSPYYIFEQAVQRNPYHEAIWTRSGSVSWKVAYDRVNQYAQLFLSHGVKPGDLVALFMQNSPDFAFAWVGLLAIGAAPAMINYHLTGKALLGCIEISTAKLILADVAPDIMAKVAEIQTELDLKGIKLVNVAEERARIYQMDPIRPRDDLRKGIGPGDPMALFYTSGTTGLPKAVLFPAAAAASVSLPSDLGYHPARDGKERCYICMPYYHGTGGITMISQILSGSTTCMASKFSVSTFWDDVRDSHATWFVYVGETLRYLVAAPPSPRDKDHNLQTAFGNGCRPDVWRRFQERFNVDTICEFYNSTEGALGLRNLSRGDFFANAIGHHGLLLRLKYRNMLIPVAIDAETGDVQRNPKTGLCIRTPYEVGGEILIEHPGERPFPGYFNNSEATDKKYVKDVLRKGDVFYRTGDAMRRDGEGRWFFLDRLGDTYRWKGENVSTAEVAEVLGEYPGVNEAVIYGVSLPGHDGKAGAAALDIAADKKASFDYADFLRYSRAKLPKYAVPIFLRLLSQGIASHNNKQNKVPLKQQGVDPSKIEGGDQLLWIEKHGKGNTYVPFTQEDWENLGRGRAKL
ncbi:Isopenicillin N epimerase component 1 [Colletotrichum sidae]|uniref:Very long-chain fatty acid transport protein n=1 Tax=Colletotrichum sidae TaxID=1347389 RepID=A0A4V3I379_9PEZI|nr:Isopenicillin N epimerase component 1 [Colletotrichum sidae]